MEPCWLQAAAGTSTAAGELLRHDPEVDLHFLLEAA
jgi:hypothetical protein